MAQGDVKRRSQETVIDCILAIDARSVRCRGDLGVVLEFARRAAVVPRVASRLSRSRLDRADAARIDESIAESTARTSLMLAEAARVCRLLAGHGIGAILLKGAAILLSGIRGEIDERHMDDIDILIAPRNADRATKALKESGFVLAERMARPGIDGRPVAEQTVRAGPHAAPGLVSPHGVAFDLHTRVPHSRVGAFDDVMKHVVSVRHDGVPLLAPSPALLCAHLCEHVVHHHAMRPKYLARHVADMVTFRDRVGGDLWRRANELSDGYSVRVSRALLEASHSRAIAPKMLLPTVRSSVVTETAWETGEALIRLRRDLAIDPRRVARKVVPSREFVAASYETTPDDPRLPYYYVHRLATLRWLLRPFRG